MNSGLTVGTIINAIKIYNQYQQKLKQDIEKYKYYKIINDKDKIIEMEAQIFKDKEELGKFLDYEV